MHPKSLLPLPLALALAACAQNGAPPPDTTASTDTPAATTAGPDALAGHHWRLESATDGDGDGARIDALFPGGDHVLTLDFADGRVAVSGGCNGQGGRVTTGDDRTLEV